MADENARTRNDTFDLGIWSFAIMARYGVNPPTMVDIFKDLLVQCRIVPRSSLLPGPIGWYLCRAEFLRCHYKTFAASVTLHHVQYGTPRWKLKDRIQGCTTPSCRHALRAIITTRTGAKVIMVIRDGVKCKMGAQDRVSNCSEAQAVERKVEQRTVDVNGKAISSHRTPRNRCGFS
ncbi:hypothetical protein CEK25_003674 [Fusarium fujikuroi]|nr:hypothetical protein CEK25_003674 [Fusarium fujikuroi]